MAVDAYYAWVRDGKPIVPAQPIQDFVTKMELGYPRAAAAHLFSWYADNRHYQADFPQDHTPYSATAWPVDPCPYPYVFATDIMDRPDLDVDCHVLFRHWLAEAKAGRMPWLKYLIWQGKSYDVRNGWQPRAASGHFDHVHLSGRTDHKDTHLGSWSPVPEDDMPTAAEIATAVWAASWNGPTGRETAAERLAMAARGTAAVVALTPKLDAILAAALDDGDTTVVLPPEAIAELQEISAALAALPDAGEVRAIVDEELDEQSRAGADNDA